ncbi:MAG: SpvB/TcaC N-terminal domain-containing protein, partial [Chloroflexota bacterium]
MKAILNIVMLFVLVFNQAGQSTWSRVLNQAETPAATPTPILESTPTETPQPAPPTPTGMPTETPILGSPTPTETPVVDPATPTETPIPDTATPTELPLPSETPTSVPTETPMPDGTPDGTATLELDFTPAGRRLILHWKTTGLAFRKDTVTLALTLPSGVTPANGDREIFDPAAGVLELDLKKPNGNVLLQSGSLEEGARISASLFRNGGLAANAVLELPAVEKHAMDERGGELATLNGRVRIKFPQSLFAGSTTVTVGRPDRRSAPDYSLSGNEFEIEAFADVNDQELAQFDNDVTLEVQYDETGIDPRREADLHLYYYNPETGEWEMLPTFVDTEKNTLVARTNHFTVFDFNFHDWQASHIPTVDAFQVSNFTGAATYSLPIEVPPGPGGLQPSLTLAYNSQVVDQTTTISQASWVGMGWSLDTGFIERNSHGTMPQTIDDTFMLNVNGVSSTIVKDSNGNYHLTDENFWKIEHDANGWTIWDKLGNKYTFAEKADLIYPTASCGENNIASLTYKWMLTSITNVHGKSLTFTYAKETKSLKFFRTGTSGDCDRAFYVDTTTAIYPDKIFYPNDRYRVRFEREERFDYQSGWTGQGGHNSFERSRLKTIFIEQDADGNGSFETIIRKYELVYVPDTNIGQLIFPNVKWSAGGRTPTLRQVLVYGKGGNTSLPATTFTYGDDLHLTRADNGYGGAVEFDYDQWVYTANAREAFEAYYEFGKYGQPCRFDDPTPWGAYDGTSSVGCTDDSVGINDLRINGIAIDKTVGKDLVRPGGAYKLVAGRADNPNVAHRIGLYDGFQYETWYVDVNSHVFTLPANAKAAAPVLQATKISGAGNQFGVYRTFKFLLLPAYSRVVEKRIINGAGQTMVYQYEYSGAAVNDNAHSESACMVEPPDCYEYVEKYSEFRGHRQVTEIGPDGKRTITEFHQDDILKGRPISVTVQDAYQTPLLMTLYEYGSQPLPLVRPKYDSSHVYSDVNRYWVYTASEENRTYANDNSYTATKVVYTYESAYGNLTSVKRQRWTGSQW